MATAAEIAHVGRIRAASADMLAAHAQDRNGLCSGCGDRRHPCSRRARAEQVFQWCSRRVREINDELDAVTALHCPTMLLPVVAR